MRKSFCLVAIVVGLLTAVTLVQGSGGAGNAASDPCSSTLKNAQQSVTDVNYTNPNLNFFHQVVARTNGMGTAPATQALCEFIQNMGMDPNLSSLPQTLTKTVTDGSGTSHTIVLTVTSPSESFATSNGYTAKATVTYDGTQFMSLWWNGSGDSSKGFMIGGNQPLVEDVYTRLFYTQWDRTTAQQFVKIYYAQFQTSYLTTAAAATTGAFGDVAIYGNVNYNTSSKAVTFQGLQIQQIFPDQQSGGSTFGCYRLMVTGTIGGTVAQYFTHLGNSNNLYDPANQTLSAGASDLDSVTGMADSTSTQAVDSNSTYVTNATASAPASFDHSCNDLDTAGQAGNPFASGTVSYTTDPSTLFP